MIISASIHCTCTYTFSSTLCTYAKSYHANNTLYLSIGLWIDSDRPSKVSCSADGLMQGFTRAVSQVMGLLVASAISLLILACRGAELFLLLCLSLVKHCLSDEGVM